MSLNRGREKEPSEYCWCWSDGWYHKKGDLMEKNLVQYQVGGREIALSHDVVRRHIDGGAHATDQEILFFMAMCQRHGLDPFIREAYLIKHENRKQGGYYPASIVISKDAYLKRAYAHPDFDGMAWAYGPEGKNGVPIWVECHVFLKSKKYPFISRVYFNEYNQNRALWLEKPFTMIRKVAQMQALRDAFPQELSQLYVAEELGAQERDSDRIAMPIEVGAIPEAMALPPAPAPVAVQETVPEPEGKNLWAQERAKFEAKNGTKPAQPDPVEIIPEIVPEPVPADPHPMGWADLATPDQKEAWNTIASIMGDDMAQKHADYIIASLARDPADAIRRAWSRYGGEYARRRIHAKKNELGIPDEQYREIKRVLKINHAHECQSMATVESFVTAMETVAKVLAAP